MNALYATLIKQLHEYAKNHQIQRAVLGLSGGLSSAVALCIAVRAFGPKNVTVLVLPEMGITPHEDIEHARALAQHFGCHSHYQPINNFLVDFNFVTWEKTESANENLKGRIRAALLRHFAESNQMLLLGSASKSDLLIGLGTPDGEFNADLHILGDLYKSDIVELGRWIGLPDELLTKAPARHLKANLTDEDEVSAPWTKIDEILRALAEGTDPEVLIQKGLDALIVHKTVRLLQQNEKGLSQIPILPIGELPAILLKAQEAEASS
jgi:NAD+ synthetase